MRLSRTGFALLLYAAFAAVQDVHVIPREIAKPEQVRADIKVKVDLALIPVLVTEKFTGRPFPGLVQGHFKLYYNKKPQTIRYFTEDDAPVSLGVVFDRSGSMGLKVESAKAILKALANACNPQDEVFLITFGEVVETSDFTSVMQEIESRTLFIDSKGRTALWDAVYLGMQKMHQAKNERRALVIITDGGDNHSRYTFEEIKNRIKETDMQFFFIDLFDPRCLPMGNPPMSSCADEVANGPDYLYELVQAAGGIGYVIEDTGMNEPGLFQDVKNAAQNIGVILRQEYILGFKPTETMKPDGKYHKIKVELQRLPKGLPELIVQPREGLYAPKD